jgi:hypothetical protein
MRKAGRKFPAFFCSEIAATHHTKLLFLNGFFLKMHARASHHF